jgi:pimeloyl-ACP methyl ester carboxylesterase
MVEVLLACIDSLIPGRNFALHGYSMGAYQARAILHHRPDQVDGISMLAPAVVADHGKREAPAFTVLIEDPQAMASLSDEERGVMESVVVRSQGMVEQIRGWPRLSEEEDSDYAYLELIHEDPARYSCSYDIDALQEPFAKPALIMTGRQDASVGYTDAWRLLNNYPRATFVVFDRAGHFMEEKDELIGHLVNEWLDRVEENLAE